MSKHSDETKAAVMAALLAGQSINQVAKEYDVPKGTVSSWRKRIGGRENATQKKEIGSLIMEYLRVNLETLAAQSELFRNPEWLKRQTASDAAVLHGVMTDKAIRLIEALSKANDGPGDEGNSPKN